MTICAQCWMASALAACLGMSCAGSAPRRPPAGPMAAVTPPPAVARQWQAPPPCPAGLAMGIIDRATINAVVDRGLGRWLGGVDVAPSVKRGQFAGWRVKTFYPDDSCYAAAGIHPGDVVVRVNGQNIERPEQASDIFNALRAAAELKIELLRDGKLQTTTFKIQ